MPIDFPQLVLTVTIVIITALLTVLGIEVFYILKDIRKLMDRLTNVVGDAEQVVKNVKKPTEMIASVSQSAELLTKMFEIVKHNNEHKQQPQLTETPMHHYVAEVVEDRPPVSQEMPKKPAEDMPQPMSLGRRFFRMPRRPVS